MCSERTFIFSIVGIVCKFVSASVPDPTQSSPEYIIFVFSKDLSHWRLETRRHFQPLFPYQLTIDKFYSNRNKKQEGRSHKKQQFVVDSPLICLSISSLYSPVNYCCKSKRCQQNEELLERQIFQSG